MSDVSSIKVAEMRIGLFFVRWILKDVLNTNLDKQKLQLPGSQSGFMFTINLDFFREDGNVHLTNGKCKFNIIVEEILPRNLPDGVMCKKVKSSMNQEELSKFNQQLAGLIVEHMVSTPVYMWVHPHTSSVYANEIPLQNIEEKMWCRQVEGSLPDAITLWIDFGTKTSGEKTIIQGLKRLLYSQNQCDVQFLCKNRQVVSAHSLILSAGSPVFAAMFQSKSLEAGIIKVKLDDFDVEVVKQLLVFLYTGNVPNLSDEKTAILLLKLSDKFGIETLKNDCVEVLRKKVTRDNAINMLILSHMRTAPKLFESALNFIAANGFEICSQQKWMDLMKNYPDLCIMATRKMTAKHGN